MSAQTLYDKLWNSHVVREEEDGTVLLYIDHHLVHKVTSPQAFKGLKMAGRKLWRIDSVVSTADHNTPHSGTAAPVTARERMISNITNPLPCAGPRHSDGT